MNNNFGVEYHLVDSCNLNCAACSHYSSLVEKKTFIPLETIISDLTKLKDKVGDNLKWLRLLGGEPLMYPNVSECLTKIRELFPKTRISLVTNGLLLNKMDDAFYDICKNCRIEVALTIYGIIDLKPIIEKLMTIGIRVRYYKNPTNKWNYQHIRLSDERIDCLEKCTLKRMCNNYRNGKIYLCPHMAYIEYFNKYFNKNIKLNESDYIDLDSIESFDGLVEKIENAKPNFCFQYCNYYDENHPSKGKWKRTEKKINEFCLLN